MSSLSVDPLLWPSRDPLGTLLGSLGASLDPLGLSWRSLGALLWPSWRPLGLSWGPLGALLGSPEALLEPSCSRVLFWTPFVTLLAPICLRFGPPFDFHYGPILGPIVGPLLDLVSDAFLQAFLGSLLAPKPPNNAPREPQNQHKP